MVGEIILDSLLGALLISGLVIVMMMMVECLNIKTQGHFFESLRTTRFGQVALSSFLGVIPGCMGGFASVSLYEHGLLSFGALIAMMIASSGDEAFAMLAMFPGKALLLFGVLFALAIVLGLLTDFVCDRFGIRPGRTSCHNMTVHEQDMHEGHSDERGGRHLSWKRAVLFVGVAAFIAALSSGLLEHEHGEDCSVGLSLLDEAWMNIMFSVLSLAVLAVIVFASDHFVQEHLFEHIVCRHLPRIFAWTFGVLVVLGLLDGVFDINDWISDNTVLMILLASAVGIIPESGPHLLFVTLFASGVVPFPVLLASCISQDGHSSIPLLAESRRDFFWAKLINFAVALAIGLICLLLTK